MKHSSTLRQLSFASATLIIGVLVSMGWIASQLDTFELSCRDQLQIFEEFERRAWNDIVALERIHSRVKRQQFVNNSERGKARTTRRKKLKKEVKVSDEIVENESLVRINENISENKYDMETEDLNEDNSSNLTYSKNGLPQLLEIHNDHHEEEKEDHEEEEIPENTMMDMSEYEEKKCDGESCSENGCPRGPPGPPGLPGPDGQHGPDGQNGTDGEDWQLLPEDKVIILGCMKCPPGPRGVEGDPGPPGDKGGPGARGADGLDGYEGFHGPPGKEGWPGEDGENGPDGWPGEHGKDVKYYINSPGAQGELGVSGPPGEPGSKGSFPMAGIDGLAGVPGAPGKHGIPGPPGAPGEPGEVGVPGTKYGQCLCPEPRRSRPPIFYPTAPPYIESTTNYRYFVKSETPSPHISLPENEYVAESGYGPRIPEEGVHRPAIPTEFIR